MSVPYSVAAHDPYDVRPPGYAAACIACGGLNDLVLRGDLFVCRDQHTCQARVRAEADHRSAVSATQR